MALLSGEVETIRQSMTRLVHTWFWMALLSGEVETISLRKECRTSPGVLDGFAIRGS